ncbi:MAG: hypothetical protein JWM10_1993 [Myxococcaceae bacterium]|nr:hypothetical protein [Myxococcaceae bacterium]
MDRFIGLDFGTTNSALALADARGGSELVRFPTREGPSSTFRSVLFFDPSELDPRLGVRAYAGPQALEHYRDAVQPGRLIQSLKSYLATDLLRSTTVFERSYTLEQLIALILRGIRAQCGDALGDPSSVVKGLVVGRPVKFSNADTPADEQRALDRLRAALAIAGIEDVTFEYEPVGAAYFYESRLDHDELVLIGDFGGGTSDFCLVRVGPTARRDASAKRILGTEGVGLAGDVFDGEIVDAVVSPRLGKGTTYRSYLDGKEIGVPSWLYERVRRWHHLSFLRSRETMKFLKEMRDQCPDPRALAALLHLVEDDLGFDLHRAVEGTKVKLSREGAVNLRFVDDPVDIDVAVARADFERWIEGDLAQLRACIDRLLAQTGVKAADVDRVFLTGGTSMVPAVRKIFVERFGENRLRAGDELTSVASGLALRARELHG